MADLLAILNARLASGQALQATLDFVNERLAWPAAELNPPPLITGDDLIEHGLEPGRRFQRLLKAARDAQLLGQLDSRQGALEYIDHIMADEDD